MKKRSEMTPKERAEYILKGASWDDAEAAGIEILARCLALHVYARRDGEEYYDHLFRRIAERADEWAHEDDSPFMLAMASIAHKYEMRNEEEGCTN